MSLKSNSARCGHVKRKLCANEPLTGKTLAFALEAIEDFRNAGNSEFLDALAKKINSGYPLDDYELSTMIDAVLPHKMLM